MQSLRLVLCLLLVVATVAFRSAGVSRGLQTHGLHSAHSVAVERRESVVMMAVPKKRTSKMKTRQRKANWYAKADKQFLRALSAAKSELNRMAKESEDDEVDEAIEEGVEAAGAVDMDGEVVEVEEIDSEEKKTD